MTDQRGFTLVEVIVAISILVLALGTVYAVFGVGHRTGAGKSSEIALSARASLDMMNTEIRNICFRKGVDQFVVDGENAVGGSEFMDSISFCTLKKEPMEGSSFGRPHPVRITYMVSAHPGSGKTMLYRTVENIGVATNESPDREPVAPYVNGLDVQYLADGIWLNGWDRKDRVPEKIRLRIGLSASDSPEDSEWFELETAPAAAGMERS